MKRIRAVLATLNFAPRWASLLLGAAFVSTGLGVPLALVFAEGLLSPPSPVGFAQDPETLLQMSRSSLTVALLPAAAASLIAIAASCYGIFSAPFQRIYDTWIFTLLFTNPVFLVLGLAVLTARLPAHFAVVSVSALILMPVAAVPLQIAADQVSRRELDAARSLGSRLPHLLCGHLLPELITSAVVATILGTVFALGFYLLPAFVGYGRIPTLGSSIYGILNRVGDSAGASQLAIILLGLELLLITVAVLFLILSRRFFRRRVPTGEGRA